MCGANCIHVSLFNFHRCAVISSIPAGATYTYKCSGMEGRYVNIVIPGKKKILTLVEVEVYGESFVKFTPSGKYNFNLLLTAKDLTDSTCCF